MPSEGRKANQENEMTQETAAGTWTRRRFTITVGAGSALAVAMTAVPYGLARAEEVPTLDEAIKKLVGDKQLADGAALISLELPQIAENGNTVPLGVSVKSPMTQEDHVTAVHIFAEANPRPDVVSFHFTPKSGVAQASTRMRLAKTQNVIAIAEMSDGTAYIAKAEVKVTIGGCGG